MSKNSEGSAPGYPIRVVSQRTGLNTPVIRAWERRYATVSPGRTAAGQRVYSDADIERLQLLATLVDAGHGIGSIADLPTESLEALVEETLVAGRSSGRAAQPALDGLVQEALSLVESLRPDALERLLMRAAVSYRTKEVIDHILVPLLKEIGSAWRTGRIGPGSEHVATVTIRRFLEWLSNVVQVDEDAPLLVTGTPAGQRHEFGALLAGLVGADEGWRIRFLGPDLPGSEIAKGALSLGAGVVALSAIYPSMDEVSVQDVISIRGRLPHSLDVVIGGPAADEHADLWGDAGILWYPSLHHLGAGLARIRTVRFGGDSP